MTEEEKSEFPSHQITGGYLKTITYKEAWKIWWGQNPHRHKEITELKDRQGNIVFDPEVFFEITGIKV